jgi:hypothetical protein
VSKGIKRQVNVGVGVDKPREDVFAAGVDDLGVGRRFDVLVDAGDFVVLVPDIGLVATRGDGFAICDEKSHGVLRESIECDEESAGIA